MTAAPNGRLKAPEENADAKANAEAETKKTTSKPQAKRAATVSANPESTSKPGDEQKPAEADSHTPSGEARTETDPENEGEAQFDVPPATPGPNDPMPEGVVQVTRKAEQGEPSDPAGNVTTQAKRGKRAAKKNAFEEIDSSKLPVSVTVGQVVLTIEEYAGRPVASFSLVGWVGDAPFKILASDIVNELEAAIEALKEQIS